jgi:hypothetical protein
MDLTSNFITLNKKSSIFFYPIFGININFLPIFWILSKEEEKFIEIHKEVKGFLII